MPKKINLAIIGAGAQAGSRGRGLLLGATYGAAMAVVYGVLGVFVILTAGTFGTINSSPWFNLAIAVLFVVLALAMFDVIVIDFSRLTHVNYAFLLPKRNGELKPFGSPTQLRRVVEQAHASGAKVLISVGGWGSDDEFEALAAAEERRARFVAAVAEFVAAYQLDGVDIDWEYPDAGASGENFLALMRDLRAALPGGVGRVR